MNNLFSRLFFLFSISSNFFCDCHLNDGIKASDCKNEIGNSHDMIKKNAEYGEEKKLNGAKFNSDITCLNVKNYVLKNGIKVTIVKKKTPVVAVSVVVGAGSFYDPYGKSGLAHYVEHSMFEGLKAGNGFLDFTKKTGAVFNAYTGYLETVFYTIVPEKFFNDLLKIESKRFSKFFIPKKVALNERNVVTQEALMYLSSDGMLLLNDVINSLYVNNNYRRPVVGYVDEVKKLTIKDVVAFKNKHYVANNMKIIVVTGLDEKFVLKKLNQYFGKIKKGKVLDRRKDINKDITSDRSNFIITKESNKVGVVSVDYFYKIRDDISEKEKVALYFISHIISSRFNPIYENLVEETKVATLFGAFFNMETSGASIVPANIFNISVKGGYGVDSNRLINAVNEEFEKFLKNGITKEQIDIVVESYRISAAFREDSVMSLFSALQRLGLNYSYDEVLKFYEIGKELDVDYVNSVFKKYFSKKPNVISIMNPIKEEKASFEENKDVK